MSGNSPTVLPAYLAAQLLRDPTGQSAGPPGMGPEPALIHEPGEDVVRGLVHPQFTITERLFRARPEDSWFNPNVSPTRPVQFELGSFTVPNSQEFWMFDYEFSVFRQSGLDPGDVIRAEEGRFSGVMGFDVTFSGRRKADLLYQLEPVPVTLQRQSFDPPTGQPAGFDQFTRSTAQSFGANASPGLSLLPVRSDRMGARNSPFTLIGSGGDRVALSVVIFRPVPSPITAIEGRLAGYLLHTQLSQALQQRVRPR